MIKVATVFSGIGSIEHSLKRMKIKHSITFACDNGGVDIFGKKIKDEVDEINNEIIYLTNHIDLMLNTTSKENTLEVCNDNELEDTKRLEFKTYVLGLKDKINTIKNQFNETLESINNLEIMNDIKNIVNQIMKILDESNDSKFKEYFDNVDNSKYLVLVTELKNYIKKKYPKLKSEFKELENISKNKEYRALRREIKELPKLLSQLHGTIKTLEELKILESIENFDEKKKYVDSLYSQKEKSNFVKKSYMANYKINNRDFHWNISLMDAREYKGKVDLFVGGSPCQSFSIVGKRGGFKDTRGTLFYEYARVLKECQPRFFIYENVKGVLSHDGGQTWEVMKNTFEDTGYKFKEYVFNSKDFGIPQHRERIFVIGFKNEDDYNKFEDPKKKELELTMDDLLEDYVDEKYYLQEKGIKFVTDEKNLKKRYTQINGEVALCQKANQQFNWHGDFIEEYTEEELKRMGKIDDKYFLSEKVKKYILSDEYFMNNKPSEELMDLDVARPLTATMHKMHRAGVDNYISYGKTLSPIDRRIRKLTPRECFRLMGFCDSFDLVCSDTQLYQQAGNSIVVDVFNSIMEELIKVHS